MQPEGFQLSFILPNPTDRALLVGQTGSGKTTLARYLLASRPYSVVVDYKGRIGWPEYKKYTTLKSLVRARESRLLFCPTLIESTDTDITNRLFEWIYRRGNCTAYVDEVAAISNRNTYPYYFGACLMRGRELGVETWSATQRPIDIPSIVLSESEHTYGFHLRLPQDRKRVQDLTGIPADALQDLQKQEFIYTAQSGDCVGPLKLRL